ncbi:MAG: cation:proton antiporter [Rhodospirillales bacterium]|nr:cation:proton antiporter [Rhodospirillales bacterium]
MFAAGAFALLATMAMALTLAIKGPTVYDRILAVNSFGTLTVMLIAVLGFVMGRPEFLDIGLVYALINFITTIAIMKFFKYHRLGHRSGEDLGDCNGDDHRYS